MPKVFLSSTSKDLSEYREAVYAAIQPRDNYQCIRMEDFGARHLHTSDFCRSKVRECDLFIGIIGHNHGSCPENDERSFTEQEYETAIEEGLPCLMFFAPDDFMPPETRRESDEKWRRQQSFRQRIKQRFPCETFKKPKDLAVKAILAISNWADQRQPPGGAPAAHKGTRQEGRLIPKMCDRTTQVDEFEEFFVEQVKSSPGSPQIYLVHGVEGEGHESLVERFSEDRLREYAKHKWSEERGVVAVKNYIDWPREGEPSLRRKRLSAKLFREFDHQYEWSRQDYSARDFAGLTSDQPDQVVVIRHEIQAKFWDRPTGELIEWYLQFWDEVRAQSLKNQFLIFFLVIYPLMESESKWRRWLNLPRFDKKRIQNELRQLFAVRQSKGSQSAPICPGKILSELTCVTSDDVMNWFKFWNIYDDYTVWRGKCNELFVSGDCRRMAEVESGLRSIHNEFLSGRGAVMSRGNAMKK